MCLNAINNSIPKGEQPRQHGLEEDADASEHAMLFVNS